VSKYGFSVFWWKPFVDMLGVFWFSRRRFSCRIEWRANAEAESAVRDLI
jgi:hypothetical protein